MLTIEISKPIPFPEKLAHSRGNQRNCITDQEKGKKRKEFCSLISIDRQNSFNYLGWIDIREAPRERASPLYLRNMVWNLPT